MKAIFLTAAFAVLTICDASVPCRCAERTLGEYYAGADEVVVGQLVDSTLATVGGAQHVEMEIRLAAAPHRTFRTDQLDVGSVVRYRTPVGSASCGVEALPGASYVIFATASDDGVPTIDSCSGSRILLGPGMPPGSFQDVPARFIPGQLNALAGMDLLGSVVENAPDPTDPANGSLIGLLDIAGFSHAGFARLHQRPDTESPVLGEIESYDDFTTFEVGYEQAAAVVYARRDGWSRLQLEDGRYGWLPPDFAGTYYPYPDVVVRRLNYLTDFHGFVWPNMGAGNPVRLSGFTDDEIPVEVHESAMLGGSPWLRVTVFRTGPCEGGEPEVLASGWIPAYGASGEPSAWFYSRGC